MVFLIAVAAVLFVIVLGVVLAWAVARFDGAVQGTKNQVENKSKNYNPAVTLGYAIDLGAAADRQVKEARLLAAKKAAVTPRGANVRIGRLGHATLKTAGKGIEDDPWTAAKIAQFHGWDGVRTGYVAAAPAVAAAPTAVSVPKPTLIEITDEMSPAEKRKARVANAKANSAYKKALKAAGGDSSVAQPTAAAAAPAPTATAKVPPPQLIEITDDMPPAEKRKARVANAKAKSAYKKALKAAGVDPKAASAPAPAPAAPSPAAAPAAAIPANAPPPPDLVEITEGMAPDEIRRARISNAKAKSAYKKALKAAGIDPATVM